MKACAGWRWSYTAMCSSMLLVSTNADCFDTSCRPSVAIKQIGFACAKLEGWYTAPLSRWGVNASLRACKSDLPFQDPRRITDDWKMTKNTPEDWSERSAVTCKADRDGSFKLSRQGLDPKKQNSFRTSCQWHTIDVMLLGFKARLLYVTFKRTVVTSKILWITR